MSIIGQPYEDDLDDLHEHNGRLLATVLQQQTVIGDLRRESERRRGQLRRARRPR